MKKKLVIIFIPIILSMLGIIFFQADWMYKTYKSEQRKINENADAALRDALIKYHNDHKNEISKLLTPHLKQLYESVSIGFHEHSDSLYINLRDKYDESDYKAPLISAQAASGFNIGRIKVSFPSRKFLNGKPVPGKNDMQAERFIRNIIPSAVLECDPSYPNLDASKILLYFRENLKEKLGRSINYAQLIFFCKPDGTSPQLSFSTGANVQKYRSNGFGHYVNNSTRWVGVHFHKPFKVILLQMIVPTVLSVTLILITIFSFFYLLTIILKQKRLADMKDDFINNMTHELKTPIATVSAAIEGMQKFNALQDQKKTERYLETSRKELNRLNEMVTKVLNTAVYETNNINLVIKPVNVTELIEDIINTEKIKTSKTVRFTFKNLGNVTQIWADNIHFRNVLTNLIDNAIKYSADMVDVTITCYRDEKFAYFSVRDNGLGIPASAVNYIFDKFYRVSTGNIHNVKGTGLGLSYAKSIIELHGGRISVKSIPGKGSEFIVLLPLYR